MADEAKQEWKNKAQAEWKNKNEPEATLLRVGIRLFEVLGLVVERLEGIETAIKGMDDSYREFLIALAEAEADKDEAQEEDS